MTRHRIAVLLELGTDDPALDLDAIDVGTAEAAARVRAAVLAALGGDSRVVAVLPLETARMIMQAYDAVSAAHGAPPDRPPANYVPPPDRDPS